MQTAPPWTLEPRIIPFPASSECLSNPSVVRFRQTSSNTRTQEWKEVTIKWKREQMERARLCLKYRSVFRQLLTLPRFDATPTTTSHPTSHPNTTTTSTTTNFTSFRMNMLAKSMKQLREKPLPPQLGRQSARLSLRTSLLTPKHMTLTKKTATQIKKTVKMPREYHGVTKMPKGWAHVAKEEGEAEVGIVWERQKMALLGCTTPGINGA